MRQPSKCWAAKYYPPSLPTQRSYFSRLCGYSGCSYVGNSQGRKSVFTCTQRAAQQWGELFAFLWQNWQKTVMGSGEISFWPATPPSCPSSLQKFVFAAGAKILFVIYCQLRLGKSFPATAANQSERKFICAPIKSPLFFALCAGACNFSHTLYNQSTLGCEHKPALTQA